MPRPLYIICSESGAEDRITGRVSLFGLVDGIQIHKLPENIGRPIVLASPQLWIVATWQRETGDEGKEFEYETLFHVPPANTTISVGKGEFAYSREFQRIIVRLSGQIPFEGPGLLRVENRIRQVGQQDWLSIQGAIRVEEVQVKLTPNEAHSGQNGD